MKACYECAIEMTDADFYKTANGRRAGICKKCHKAKMKVRRLTNPHVQQYDRERSKTAERKAAARQITIRWRAKHPDAYRAHTSVGNALRDGKLVKEPCSICGTNTSVHAHHKDYSKPLSVIWLCAKCHHRVHATFPELGGHFQAAE